MAVAICSLEVRAAASGVFVSEGATQLTRIFGASSAASDSMRPSTAPFAMPIEAWEAKPCATATVENRTMLDGAVIGLQRGQCRLHGAEARPAH